MYFGVLFIGLIGNYFRSDANWPLIIYVWLKYVWFYYIFILNISRSKFFNVFLLDFTDHTHRFSIVNFIILFPILKLFWLFFLNLVSSMFKRSLFVKWHVYNFIYIFSNVSYFYFNRRELVSPSPPRPDLKIPFPEFSTASSSINMAFAMISRWRRIKKSSKTLMW